MLIRLMDTCLVRTTLRACGQLALYHATFAIATHAFATGVRHFNTLAHGCVQQVFGGSAVKRNIATFNLNRETHT